MINDTSSPVILDIQDKPNDKPAMNDKTMPQVIKETTTEAQAALDDPFDFEHSIKTVAVVGAGPSGVSSR
jgi:NADH dehydrogenase FAD-containing subunit